VWRGPTTCAQSSSFQSRSPWLFHSYPQTVKGTADDEAAIRSVIKQWDAAWSLHDAKALLAHNTENADTVNRHGLYVSHADLEKHVGQMFKGTFNDTQSAPQTIFVVRFIRPDVAIVRTLWETPELMINGREVPREDMIVSYVNDQRHRQMVHRRSGPSRRERGRCFRRTYRSSPGSEAIGSY
jgi:uncharacterized protein (TIGR02246 family)